jgi:hypothetical protein
MTQNNPKWWTEENDSAWERTKAALKRDWDQTKHDFGGNEPETNQNVDDTVKQAAGKQSIPPRRAFNYEEDVAPAQRFGIGARSHYRAQYPQWNSETEIRLKREWHELNPHRANRWNNDLQAIRYGWDYDTELTGAEGAEEEIRRSDA